MVSLSEISRHASRITLRSLYIQQDGGEAWKQMRESSFGSNLYSSASSCPTSTERDCGRSCVSGRTTWLTEFVRKATRAAPSRHRCWTELGLRVDYDQDQFCERYVLTMMSKEWMDPKLRDAEKASWKGSADGAEDPDSNDPDAMLRRSHMKLRLMGVQHWCRMHRRRECVGLESAKKRGGPDIPVSPFHGKCKEGGGAVPQIKQCCCSGERRTKTPDLQQVSAMYLNDVYVFENAAQSVVLDSDISDVFKQQGSSLRPLPRITVIFIIALALKLSSYSKRPPEIHSSSAKFLLHRENSLWRTIDSLAALKYNNKRTVATPLVVARNVECHWSRPSILSVYRYTFTIDVDTSVTPDTPNRLSTCCADDAVVQMMLVSSLSVARRAG
ncbi:hypothetical protein BD410DRAFT_805275 [Rickenella mellea]|uniref:Uncharacterized protein n=1 Tax=Rickenella mellea TaxID=50990 RepID=A0A4Y7PX79_9AGAM|nr:hypothetical protein BD410DRAFT_805275 [Rickenella mellea]